MPKNKKWKTVSIRVELYNIIKKVVEDSPQYESIAEFLREALMRRLEALGKPGET